MATVLPFLPKSREVRRQVLVENIHRTMAELNDLIAELNRMKVLLDELNKEGD